MRALSEATVAMIDEAHRLASRRGLRSKRAVVASVVKQLGKVAATEEWLAIPRIISLTLDRRRTIAEAAARAVKDLRLSLRIKDFGLLDRAFRDLSPYMHGEYMPWRSMGSDELRNVSRLESGAAVLQQAMCHPNGFVREEAIRRSATCCDGSEIPILLLRCNDWVMQVRAAAQAAVRARIRVEQLPNLIAAMPMLDQMRRWERMGDRKVVEELDELLRSAESVAPLVGALSSHERFIRRGAYRRLVESEHSDQRDVYQRALSERDPAIRMWAGRRLSSAAAGLFKIYFEQLRTSPLEAIRVRAVERAVKLEIPLPWEELLFDSHVGVRAVAQNCARDAGADAAARYRERLDSAHGAVLAAALRGLGETSDAEGDAEIIRRYFQKEGARVRRAALYALAELKVGDIVELALSSLHDQSPSVAHAGRDLLRSGVGYLRPRDVWKTFDGATTLWGKTDTLAVLAGLDYWEGLPYLLRASAGPDEEVRSRADIYLGKWTIRQNRVFTTPSAAVVEAIREAASLTGIHSDIRREVLFVLESRRA